MSIERHDLPENIRQELPESAQRLYSEAYRLAFEQFRRGNRRTEEDRARERNARKMAWSAVKEKFELHADGTWRRRMVAGSEVQKRTSAFMNREIADEDAPVVE